LIVFARKSVSPSGSFYRCNPLPMHHSAVGCTFHGFALL
jgi:hypothetical protein